MIDNHGLCVLSDRYFEQFKMFCHNRNMDNKSEKRPYYLAVRGDDIMWLVPLSSKVDKYTLAIERYEQKHGKGNCIFYYIAKIKRKDSVFLIGDVIPVTEEYIKKPFTVGGKPFVIENTHIIKQIKSRLSRYLTLVRAGKLSPAVDILGIEKELKGSGRS